MQQLLEGLPIPDLVMRDTASDKSSKAGISRGDAAPWQGRRARLAKPRMPGRAGSRKQRLEQPI